MFFPLVWRGESSADKSVLTLYCYYQRERERERILSRMSQRKAVKRRETTGDIKCDKRRHSKSDDVYHCEVLPGLKMHFVLILRMYTREENGEFFLSFRSIFRGKTIKVFSIVLCY